MRKREKKRQQKARATGKQLKKPAKGSGGKQGKRQNKKGSKGSSSKSSGSAAPAQAVQPKNTPTLKTAPQKVSKTEKIVSSTETKSAVNQSKTGTTTNVDLLAGAVAGINASQQSNPSSQQTIQEQKSIQGKQQNFPKIQQVTASENDNFGFSEDLFKNDIKINENDKKILEVLRAHQYALAGTNEKQEATLKTYLQKLNLQISQDANPTFANNFKTKIDENFFLDSFRKVKAEASSKINKEEIQNKIDNLKNIILRNLEGGKNVEGEGGFNLAYTVLHLKIYTSKMNEIIKQQKMQIKNENIEKNRQAKDAKSQKNIQEAIQKREDNIGKIQNKYASPKSRFLTGTSALREIEDDAEKEQTEDDIEQINEIEKLNEIIKYHSGYNYDNLQSITEFVERLNKFPNLKKTYNNDQDINFSELYKKASLLKEQVEKSKNKYLLQMQIKNFYNKMRLNLGPNPAYKILEYRIMKDYLAILDKKDKETSDRLVNLEKDRVSFDAKLKETDQTINSPIPSLNEIIKFYSSFTAFFNTKKGIVDFVLAMNRNSDLLKKYNKTKQIDVINFEKTIKDTKAKIASIPKYDEIQNRDRNVLQNINTNYNQSNSDLANNVVKHILYQNKLVELILAE